MKGRYAGGRMTVYGTIIPGVRSIAQGAWKTEHLTQEARKRLKILDWHRAHGNNVSLTARHFGIGRTTMHRWLKRSQRTGPVGLNECSKRPKRFRQPTTLSHVVMRTVQLRKQYPAWSKYKIQALLREEGVVVSASTVGRILKRRGLIDLKKSKKRRKAALRPRTRFPRGLSIQEPGDMVQIDTKYIMLPGGRKYYQFTAIDVLTKWRVLRVYPSQSSRNGAAFLQECLSCFPFLVKAVQTDNGSPFLKEFEKLCESKNLPHYFIHPRTPKQNSYVESSHGADEREFYQQGNTHILLPAMQREIRAWENIWNTIRPHESLNQITPRKYLENIQIKGRIPTKDTIVLQT
jgi:putative transposase